MTFDDRLGWFILGCAIGFVLGFIVRALKEIKDMTETIDEHVTGHTPKRNIRRPSENMITRIGVVITVIIACVAAFKSQQATNEVQSQQDQIRHIQSCTTTFLAKTIDALNQRTVYTKAQADSNVALQKAQSEFLKALLQPNRTEASRVHATTTYVAALDNFIKINGQTNSNRQDNPYPTPKEFIDCLDGKVSK